MYVVTTDQLAIDQPSYFDAVATWPTRNGLRNLLRNPIKDEGIFITRVIINNAQSYVYIYLYCTFSDKRN